MDGDDMLKRRMETAVKITDAKMALAVACRGGQLRMSIPADPKHDHDLIIAEALRVAGELLDDLGIAEARQRAELAEARRARDECAARSKAVMDTAVNIERKTWHSALDAVEKWTGRNGEEIKALRARHPRAVVQEPPAPETWMGPYICRECGRIDSGSRVTSPDADGGYYHRHGKYWGECYGEYIPYDRRKPIEVKGG